ncbi:two-partner secretion domain-containing protein [Luteimonas sp. A482]
MNHIYRIVFNRALGLVQVASELASGRGAGGASRCGSRPGRRSVLAIALVLASGGALAQVAPGQLPTGWDAVGGIGNITPDDTTLSITQIDDRALIRWDTFDIGTMALVEFEQVAGQVALNQILDVNASQILGNLSADGTIFLINPNGIVFGEDATISVGGLVASTLMPDDPDEFLDMGVDSFVWREGGTAGTVINRGTITITAADGSVVLLGGAAQNMAGASIDVGTGLAALLGGGQAQVELVPGGTVVQITGPVAGLPVGMSASVLNAGTISAHGGAIRLQGELAPGLSTAVMNTGTLAAGSIGLGPDGTISLLAGGASGDLTVGGNIDAGAGQVDLQASGNINLSAALTTGAFDVSAARLLQTGGQVHASGASSVVTSGTAQLNRAANDFEGTLDLSASSGVVRDANALRLGTLDVGYLEAVSAGALSLGTGVISGGLDAISTGGNITQSGGLSVDGWVLINADTGNITLDHVANDFTGSVEFSGGVVNLRDANALTLYLVSADSLDVASTGSLNLGTGVIAGDLTATSSGGQIVQTNVLAVGGNATIDAGTGGINLMAFANEFEGTVSLSGGPVSVRDANALRLGTLDASSLQVTSAGALSLGEGVIGGSLIANSNGGSITQAGALRVDGVSTINAGSGAITLSNAGNDFRNLVNLAGGVAVLRDMNALGLGALNVTSLAVTSGGALSLGSGAIGGNLTATTTSGGITQTGALLVAGASSIDAGASAVTLANAGNDFAGTVNLRGGAVAITDANALTLGQVDAASLTADANTIRLSGDVTTSGNQDYDGAVVLAANAALAAGGNVDFASTLDGAHRLSVDADGAVAFGGAVGGVTTLAGLDVDAGSFSTDSMIRVTGDLSIAVQTGGITQSVALWGEFSVGGDAIFDVGTGNITLTNINNDFVGAVSLRGGPVSVRDANSLSLGTLDVSSLQAVTTGALSLGEGAVAGNLTAISQGGHITQTGALSVGAVTTILAGAGDITLDNGDNDFTGNVSFQGAAVSVHDANVLGLGSVNAASLTAGSVGALSLGIGTITGNLVATSGGGGISQSGALRVGGTSTIDAGAGGINLANSGNDFTGAVQLRGGTVAIRDANLLQLDEVDANSLQAMATTIGLGGDVTTSGDQAYAGAVLLGADAVLAAGGHVFFGSTLNGAHRLRVDADGEVMFVGAVGGGTALAGLDVDAGSFSAASTINVGDLSIAVQTGDILQSAVFQVGGSASFDAGTGNITLTNIGNDFVGPVDLRGAMVLVNDTNALSLGTLDVGSLDVGSAGALSLGAGAVAGTLDANSGGGNITQTGALHVGGDSIIFASTGSITLSNAGNDFVGTTNLMGGAISVRDANTLRLGFIDADSLTAASAGELSLGYGGISGNLVATSGGGNISQLIELAVGGTSTIDAGAGDITLTDARNDFVGAVDLRGGAVAITDANVLTLGQVDATSLHATAVTIGLSGDVSTSGDQQYDGALGLGADLALTSGGNVGFGSTIDGAHRLSVDADGAVAFGAAVGGGTALVALDVDAGSFSAASTIDVGGDLSIAVQTGGIAQSGAFTVGGSASFDAGAGNISLTNAGNDFIGAVDLRGGAVAIADANALTLGQVDVASLHATAATIGLSGDVTTSGGQQYDGSLRLGADVALTSGGNVGFGSTIDGAHRLSVDAAGAVAFGAAVGSGTALAALDVDAGSFSAASTIEVDGDLSIAVQTGGIAQSGAFTVGGLSNFDAGTGAITLDNSGNDFTGAVSLTGGAVAIADANALTLGQINVASLHATAATIGLSGDVTTSGDQQYDGTLDLAADLALTAGGDVGFGSTLDGAHRLLVDADGAVTFGAAVGGDTALAALDVDAGSFSAVATIAVDGDLSIAVQAGGIAQSGAFTVGGSASFDAGAGNISLTNAGNDFAGAVDLSGGDAAIRDSNALTLGALAVDTLSANSRDALGLGQGVVGGNLSASSQGGGVTQSGVLHVGGASTIDAGGGAITLADAGNDFVGAVSLTGGVAAIRDGNALVLGALDVEALSASSLGALGLGSGTIAGDLVADSHGGAITQAGALRVDGASTIDAGAGAITLANGGNDFAGTVSLAGGAVAISDVNELALGTLDVGALSAGSNGALGLGTGTIAGPLVASSQGGAITQSGALQVAGASTINAGSGAITLDHAGNDFVGAVALSGGAATIRDSNALVLSALDVDALSASSQGALGLGNGTISGDLSAESHGGAVTQSGALHIGGASTIDAGAGAIILANAGNDFAGEVSLSGAAASIRDRNALTLATLDVDSLTATNQGALGLGSGGIAGALTAGSGGGAITQSGALTVGAPATLDAERGSITLINAGNDFVGEVSLGGGAVLINDANALTLGALDIGSLAATSHGALDLGAGTIAGNLAASSDGGAITQSGALHVDGTSALNAGNGAIVLANAGNDFVGEVSLVGGAVSIHDRNTLSLGAVDAASLQASANAIVLRQNIATVGDQVYDGALALANDVALEAGGNVAFGSTVGGAHALSVDADRHVGFADTVAVGALAVDAGSFTAASTLDVGGDLSLAVRSGGIAQSGAFQVGGSAHFDAGSGDIALDNASNDFGGPVGLAGGAITLRDRNDLTLSHLRSGQDANVQVVAAGALTLPVQAIDTGTGNLHLAAQGGTLTTRAALGGGDITLQGATGVMLNNDVLASGSLHLESGGDLVQSSGRVGAALLTGSAAGEARLAGANRIEQLGAFSASRIHLANAGPLAVTGPVDARTGALLVTLSEGDLAIDGRMSAADIRLEVAGGIAQGADGQLLARTLSGRAGGAVNLGDATRFVDNQVERIGDFTARSGFSMTNGRSLTLASLNGSNFTIDAGTADFHIEVDGDLHQDGTDWLYNGRGTWLASGGIGLPASPIYVMGLESQVATLGAPPAYFYAVRPDGSLLPIVGDAVNVPTSVWAGRAQTSSNRQVAYVDVGADASNYRGYGLVEPGVRLPADQQPECDPDFPSPECEALQ